MDSKKNQYPDSEQIDSENLHITGAHRKLDAGEVLNLQVKNDVLIIVTHAYGPKGDNLVGISDVKFDGYPAVTVKVKVGDREGLVHLSPFHGDRRKSGMTDLPTGARCELFCPVSGEPLDHLGKVASGSGADYYAIYLTPKLSEGEVVAISNIWEDYHSRIVDHFELISAWADGSDEDAE